LLDGIHLPDGVRLSGARRVGRGLAAGGGGRLALALEPALQGAGAGQRHEFGPEVGQA
jgi:hypothetical protein